MEEPLSIATFEPERAHPPYLNTPRSLEACRLNGVNPVELVEIPISEFQKDFPDDPDAAQRRYERIDGARRRSLAAVTKDWKKLCATNWQPSPTRPKTVKESILNVQPEAHCTLLEIQAARFRKIEQENWIRLQRTLKIQLKKADREVRNKKIERKHEEIQSNNDEQRKLFMQKREQLMKEQIEKERKEEEDRKRELRQQQERDAEYARQKKIAEQVRLAREKQLREKRESERLQRQEYTRRMKDSIVNGLESKISEKKKIQEMRDKNIQDRLEETRAAREKEIRERRRQEEEKARKAKEEAVRRSEEERQATLEKIRQHEEHRNKILEGRQEQNKLMKDVDGDKSKDKIKQIQDEKDRLLQEKTEKTLRELQLKEEMSRQEMEKIKEAQNRRKTIKAIRQESFEIAAARRRKQEEYRKARLEKELKDKEDRCNAIKKGNVTLTQMRNSMRDIMVKTTLELKEEIHRLQHHDEFDPEKVVEKAMQVSDKILFPKLRNTFGIADNDVDEKKYGISHSADDANEDNPFAGTFQTQQFDLDTGGNHMNRKDRKKMFSRSVNALHDISDPEKLNRTGFATMPIHTLTHDKLNAALLETKQRLEKQFDPFDVRTQSRARTSPQRMRSKNSSPSNGEANYSPNRENKEDEEEFIQLRPIVTPETKKGDDENKTTKRKSNNGRTKSRKENKSEKLQDDMKLPMYPFKPAEGITGASPVNRASSPEEPERDVTTPSDEPVYDPYGRKYIKPIDPEEKYRTDINSKAKFLETTPGKFRREFSADHPLVKGGTGKYSTELENGMQPVGMSIEPLEKEGLKTESMEDTLKTASKIERLTFAAETSVADPQAMLEQLKKIQNERLLKVLEEERKAEEDRSRMIKKVADEQERAQLESVFAEERKKASERILSVTREHETAMKDAVLGMMNLGIAKKKKSAR